ncbi:MAG TPA: class IV adenylate cyclase [Candidatus Acidoferrales bacterium]|nr:class IV adenylate cyclase [Candidatus Acidoferrales bacterium]
MARAPRKRSATETEIKLRVRDLAEAIGRIRAIGARGGESVFEENTLYDTPGSDLRRGGCLLRLRTERKAAGRAARGVLTAKMPVAGDPAAKRYKRKAEREAILREPARWPGALRSLGFRAGFRYQKYRTAFRLGGVHLDLDETPVGNFLELEGPPRAIDRVARRLGYRPKDYIRENYWGLYAADCRARGQAPGNMVFAR